MSTRVVNAETHLPVLAARLQAAGAVEIRKQMNAALRLAVVPVVESIQRESGMDFPKRGGLNVLMQRRKPRRVVKTTGKNLWIQVRYTGPAKYGDSGPWLHPLFGRNRTPKPNSTWRETSFARSVGYYERGGEKARPMAEALMERVLIEIDRLVQEEL